MCDTLPSDVIYSAVVCELSVAESTIWYFQKKEKKFPNVYVSIIEKGLK